MSAAKKKAAPAATPAAEPAIVKVIHTAEGPKKITVGGPRKSRAAEPSTGTTPASVSGSAAPEARPPDPPADAPVWPWVVVAAVVGVAIVGAAVVVLRD